MKTHLSVILILFITGILSVNILYGQDNRERIGYEDIIKTGINYYNYAEKDKINFEVSVWGFVKNPGKYLIPNGTSFIDLISLCGGPVNEAKLEDIRIVRLKNDTLGVKEEKIINLNYNDFLWEEKISNVKRQNPVLYPGDIILIPGGPKYFFRENITLILTGLTTLTSIAVLIVTILRN
jgi:polysaccharide biosynthesis/export protein